MQVDSLEKLKNILSASSSCNLYIAGAGRNGSIFGKYLDREDICWKGFVDSNSSLSEVDGKSVWRYSDIQDNEALYIVSSFTYSKEIVAELHKVNVKDEAILAFSNESVFYKVYDLLTDYTNYVNRMKKFQNSRSGRCFVIGNGPSLTIADLEQTSRDVTFAVNSIYGVYPHTKWRPTYYVTQDPIFCNDLARHSEKVKTILEDCTQAFTSANNDLFSYRDTFPNLNYYETRSGLVDNQPSRFSEDCSNCVYSSGTVTYAALQLAVYMGFTEIYLLGIDFSFSVEVHQDGTVVEKNISDHMSEIEGEDQLTHKATEQRFGYHYVAEIDKQLQGYLGAKKYADAHGIGIFNATRGGKLEVFPRVDFDSLF